MPRYFKDASGKTNYYVIVNDSGCYIPENRLYRRADDITKAIMADKSLRRLSDAAKEVARKAMSLGIEYRNHPKAGCKTYMLDQSLVYMHAVLKNLSWFDADPVVTPLMVEELKGLFDNSGCELSKAMVSGAKAEEKVSESTSRMQDYSQANAMAPEVDKKEDLGQYIKSLFREMEKSPPPVIAPTNRFFLDFGKNYILAEIPDILRKCKNDDIVEVRVHKGQFYPVKEVYGQYGWGTIRPWEGTKIHVNLYKVDSKVFRYTVGEILQFWGEQFGCELTPTSGGYKVIRCKIKWPIVKEDLDSLKYTLGKRKQSICVESYDPDKGYSWDLDTTLVLEKIQKKIKTERYHSQNGDEWWGENFLVEYEKGKFRSELNIKRYFQCPEEFEHNTGVVSGDIQYDVGENVLSSMKRFFDAKIISDGSHDKYGVPMYSRCYKELHQKWKDSGARPWFEK
jgi:hypothetical protein